MELDDYLKIKKRVDLLSKRLVDSFDRAMGSIKIRDIYVYAEQTSYSIGEHNFIGVTHEDELKRLEDHIHFLMKMANQFHAKENPQVVTRVLVPEFSLYTRTPLTMEEFTHLLKKIESYAAEQSPNVHLLLSSLAVKVTSNKLINQKLTEINELINQTLYVQCGPVPKINSITKAYASSGDKTYEKIALYAQQSEETYLEKMQTEKLKPSSELAFTDSGWAVSSMSVFEVEVNGKKYLQAIDVCLDHSVQHSKNLLMNTLMLSEDTLIPSQVDHILTSNTIKTYDEAKLTEHVVHIDPTETPATLMRRIENNLTADDIVATLAAFPSYASHIFKVESQQDSLILTTPVFGGTLTISPTRSRLVGEFEDKLSLQIEQHNRQALFNKVRAVFAGRNELANFDAYTDFIEKVSQIDDHILTLFANLNNQCIAPKGFLNMPISKEMKKTQVAVRDLLDANLEVYHKLEEDPFMLNMNYKIFLNDLKFQLKQLPSHSKNFINKLISDIDTVIERTSPHPDKEASP